MRANRDLRLNNKVRTVTFLLLLAGSVAAQESDTAAAHLKKAEAEWALDHFVEAESEYKKANQLDGRDPNTWWGLARVAELYSFHKTAALYISRAHNLAPQSAELELAYARTLEPAAEQADLEQFVRGVPANSDQALKRVESRLTFLKRSGNRESALITPYQSKSISLVPLLNGIHHQRGWGLSVAINGARPVILVLDTGASGILLNPKSAQRAGLERIADTAFLGFGDGGIQRGFLACARSVKVGGVEFENVPIEVSERKTLDETEGLIGADTFQKFLVTLDFPHGVMRLDLLAPREGRLSDRAASSPDRKGWTNVYRYGHMLLVRTRVSDSEPTLFLLDTGAEHSLIDKDFAANNSKVSRNDYQTLRGVSGTVKRTYNTDQLKLYFAGFVQQNLGMITVDMKGTRHSGGMDIPGVMGISLLKLFTFSIDYRDGLVKFDYKG